MLKPIKHYHVYVTD